MAETSVPFGKRFLTAIGYGGMVAPIFGILGANLSILFPSVTPIMGAVAFGTSAIAGSIGIAFAQDMK